MPISSLRQSIEEVSNANSMSIEEGRKKAEPIRSGYAVGIPMGGADEFNQGDSNSPGAIDRQSMMMELWEAYVACPWVSAAIDNIARTATAGGLEVVPKGGIYSGLNPVPATPDVKRVQDLLDYVSPQSDIRQLMRGVITDMEVYGDSFTEVVYNKLGEPVALYTLDPTTMLIQADEHGMVKGYIQKTVTNRRAYFQPKEVIHVKFDTPGDTLYGISPLQKITISVESWLFTAALIKSTMKKGDPLRLWIDWPIALPESDQKRFSQQYHVRNLGPKNIGNPVETKGGSVLKELGINQIQHWVVNLDKRRDEILSGLGVPPSKVGVIEAGNIGGGTGSSQDRTFKINTVGPVQELVLEKWTFALLKTAFGIDDWILQFGTVDWADDLVIEQIRDLRIRNGTNTLNVARSQIGQPPTLGGNDAVLIDRQNMVLWEDLNPLSKANLEVAKSQAAANAQTSVGPPAKSTGSGINAVKAPSTNPGSVQTKTGKQKVGSPGRIPAPKGTEASEIFNRMTEDLEEDDGYIYNINGSRTRK